MTGDKVDFTIHFRFQIGGKLPKLILICKRPTGIAWDIISVNLVMGAVDL